MTALVLPLADPTADLARVGGKGSSLAKLFRAGLPVPPGFHVTTAAYRAFVARNALQAGILEAIRDEPEKAAKRISDLFQAHDMPEEIATAIRESYARMNGVAVAVRSSATAEDLP